MKSKIVYVVSSGESDIYLEQTFLSVFSLKKRNPSVFVELVVDERTDATISGKRAAILQYIDLKTVVNVPHIFDKAQTSRWLKTSLRKYVEGDFLFIDSDTIITEDLCDIDLFEGDIGAVLNVHILAGSHPNRRNLKFWAERDGWTYSDDLKYFNSGVMFVRDTPKAHQLFDKWHQRWNDGLRKYNHVFDQTYLAAANEECGYPIKELDGIWNCQLVKNGLRYLNRAQIIHYLAFNQYCNNPVWAFYDKSIYINIKEEGRINNTICDLLENAKSAFPEQSCILSNVDLRLVQTRLFAFLSKHPFGFVHLDNLIKKIIFYVKYLFKR